MEIQGFELDGYRGETLRGDLRLPGGLARGRVILLHGFKGFKDWGFLPFVAGSICEAGFAVASFSASHAGVGPEGGETFDRLDLFERSSWSAYLADLATVMDAMVAGAAVFGDVEADEGPIHLVGHSMGGGLAVLHASQDPRIASVSLLAAVSHVVRFGEDDRAHWRREGRVPIENQRTGQTMWLGIDFLDDIERNSERLDIGAAARALRVPALVVHGSADETVPIDEGHALDGWLTDSRLHVLDGVSHSFDESHPFDGPGPAITRTATLVRGFLDEVDPAS